MDPSWRDDWHRLIGLGALGEGEGVRLDVDGTPVVARRHAGEIVARLVDNLHNGMNDPEQAVMDRALAVTVSREESAAVLPEIRRALAIEIQGGGAARVDAVTDVAVEGVEGLGAGFRTQAEWTAEASAGHWGHLHRRSLRFSALMELMPEEGAWKLSGLTVVGVRPVE